jgi:hypothetical protein
MALRHWAAFYAGVLWFLIGMALFVVHAQDKPPAPPTLTPTEVQSLRLQVRQRDALIAKQALDSAQAKFQQALKDLSDEAERVKSDNHWDKSVTFDMNDLHFTAVAKEPVKDKSAPTVKP